MTIDYDKTSEQAQVFFKKVQNKMLWATTGKTAAELIENRSNPERIAPALKTCGLGGMQYAVSNLLATEGHCTF